MNTRSIVTGALGAAGIILAAVTLKLAEHAQVIPALSSGRGFQVIVGLGLAFYANFIPKSLGVMGHPDIATRKQAAARVAGWSFTLAGLAYAGFSAAMPMHLGDILAMGAMGAAMAVTLVYALACLIVAARTPRGTAG